MKNKKILYIFGTIIGLILISSVGYFFNENQKKKILLNSVENKKCIADEKLCVFSKHKYFDDKIQIQILLFPGEYYFTDEKFNSKSGEKFQVPNHFDVASILYSLDDFWVQNWVSSIIHKNTFITIKFQDEDNFLIDEFNIRFDKVSTTRLVNSFGEPYGLQFETNYRMYEERYRTIKKIDFSWEANLRSLLPR